MIGSGRLASMLLSVLEKDESTYVFGRNEQTVDSLLRQVDFAKKATVQNLSEAKVLFLCLPKEGYNDFFSHYLKLLRKDVTIYHMATAVMKKEVEQFAGGLRIVPLKLVGHAKVTKANKAGLFVLPPSCEKEMTHLKRWFPSMKIELTGEEMALLANQLGTEAAIKMSMNLTEKMKAHKIPDSLIKQTFDQTVHGVIDAYQANDLGGFAKRIVEQQKKGEDLDEDG